MISLAHAGCAPRCSVFCPGSWMAKLVDWMRGPQHMGGCCELGGRDRTRPEAALAWEYNAYIVSPCVCYCVLFVMSPRSWRVFEMLTWWALEAPGAGGSSDRPRADPEDPAYIGPESRPQIDAEGTPRIGPESSRSPRGRGADSPEGSALEIVAGGRVTHELPMSGSRLSPRHGRSVLGCGGAVSATGPGSGPSLVPYR